MSWRNYLYKGGSEPEIGLERFPPVFIGRSQLGSVVEVRESSQGDYEVIVDGKQVERLPNTFSFGNGHSTMVRLVGQEWTEFSRASEPALQAIKSYLKSATGEPPWQWARILFADGLIDLNFGLTLRGRRLLNQSGS